jgi:hypothetical protein
MDIDINKLCIFDSQANCSEIRSVLKEIDTDFDVEFIAGKYIVTHKGNYFTQVNYGEFCRNTMENIRKTVWINKHGSVLEEIDKNNEKIEKSHDRDLSNLAECMAKDLRKPLLDVIDYGR